VDSAYNVSRENFSQDSFDSYGFLRRNDSTSSVSSAGKPLNRQLLDVKLLAGQLRNFLLFYNKAPL
jgi:hypothetical protein